MRKQFLIIITIALGSFTLFSQEFSYHNSKIAFASNRDGNFEIYIMNLDGSQLTNLTRDDSYDEYPSWSPDGKKIAYCSMREGVWNMDIYIIDADGSNKTRLTDNPAFEAFPSWSPNGQKIAFQTTRDGKEEIYMMNVDGSKQTNLTNHPASDRCFSWSPDGNKIAFSSDRDGKEGIYIMNTDGSEQVWIRNNHAMCPSWSPDGKSIVFYSLNMDDIEEENEGKESQYWYEVNMEIYIMNADGSDQVNITNSPSYDGYPSWSPSLIEN